MNKLELLQRLGVQLIILGLLIICGLCLVAGIVGGGS